MTDQMLIARPLVLQAVEAFPFSCLIERDRTRHQIIRWRDSNIVSDIVWNSRDR